MSEFVKMKEKLIFIHIPKTAGSTFHVMLNARYPQSGIQNLFGSRYSEPEIAGFMSKPNEQKENICLLKGHMPYGMHRHLPGDSRYITVLRSPVERVISQYYYIKKNAHNPLHKQVHGGGMTIADFVSSGISVGMNNGQCRFLNGDLDEYAFNACNEALFENVKKHIEDKFIWVGLTERFDESVLLLAKLLEWERSPHYIRENISKIRKTTSEISESDIAAIKAYNQLDIKLYEYANQLMDKQIAEIPDFDIQLNTFKKKNHQIQQRWSWLPSSLKRFVI